MGNNNRAPEEEERRRLQAQLLALPGNAWDAGAGALRGAVGATLGVGGDLERLIRAGYGALTAPSGQRLESALGGLDSDTVMPNTEDMLHGNKWFSLPPGIDAPAFDTGQSVGEWLPVTPGTASKVAGRALQAAKRGVQGVGGLAAEAARRGVEQGRGPLGALSLVAQPHYAVRPRGGNFNEDSVNSYVNKINDWEPIDEDNSPVNAWLNKSLRGYLKKDLGAPTDPLLQLEKELPGLHFPPGALEEAATRAERVNRMPPVDEMPKAWLSPQQTGQTATYAKQAAAHRALTDDPLTAWGARSDAHVRSEPLLSHIAGEYNMNGYSAPEYLKANAPTGHQFQKAMTPEEQALAVLRGEENIPNLTHWQSPGEADAIRKKYGWALKDPDAKMHYLKSPLDDDPLGFGHVRDYLSAATDPYTRVRHMHAPGQRPRYPDRGTPESNVGADEELMKIIRGEDDGMHPFAPQDIAQWRALHNAGLLVNPDVLPRTSVADAVRKTAQWNEFLAKKQDEVSPGLSKGIAAVHKEYPEGMRWVRLGVDESKVPEPITPPTREELINELEYRRSRESGVTGRMPALEVYPPEAGYDPSHRLIDPHNGEILGRGATPEEAWDNALKPFHEVIVGQRERKAREALQGDLREGLNAEGDAMGHCVGGYCGEVAERGTQIYSLRDAQNRPHVTVEARPGSQFERWYDRIPDDLHQAYVDEFIAKNPQFADRERVNSPEWAAFLKAMPGAPADSLDILQIKGKQNAAPVDKYLPYVQDFVRSGQWGEVGDLGNTGLHHMQVPRLYEAPNGATIHFDEGYHTIDELTNKLKVEGGMDDTKASAAAFHLVQGARRRQGYAQGGSVTAYTPPAQPTFRQQLLARLEG